jgi:hypothetical protein
MSLEMAPPDLLNLPVELLIHIMRIVEPEDLLAIKASCKQFRELCKRNPVVYEYNLRGRMVRDVNQNDSGLHMGKE